MSIFNEDYEDLLYNCTVKQLLSRLEGYHIYSILGLYKNNKDSTKSYWSLDFKTREEMKPKDLVDFKSETGVTYNEIKDLRIHKWYVNCLNNGNTEIQIFLKENYKHLPVDGVRII